MKIQAVVQSELRNSNFSVQIRQFRYDRPYTINLEPDTWFRLGQLLKPSTTSTFRFSGVGVEEPVDGSAPLCIPPGVVLNAYGCEDRPRDVVLGFSKSYFHRLTGHSGDLSRTELRASLRVIDRNVTYTLNRLAAELETPGLASTLLVESLSSSLIVDLCRYFTHANKEDSRRLVGLSRRQLSLIHERAHQDGRAPNILELAELCDLSERQLMRLFKRSTNMTIHSYIEDIRLKRAIELLSHTNLSLKEIAYHLGFSAPSSFSNAFRRLTGASPSLYRQATRLSRNHA